MRMALVSGDGLPVSGLLTVFRNVVDLAMRQGLLDGPVTADLGYSWRPDKPAIYPHGGGADGYPEWLDVTDATPVPDTAWLADELTEIRNLVARAETLSAVEQADLWRRIEVVAEPYERHFTDWFDRCEVDWVCAVNMTLSDAVPVTLALHRAADRRWGGRRPGGVLFWDHDLYASYAVHEGDLRVYPTAPNQFTPLPVADRGHRWAVVSDGLAKETTVYPTDLTAELVPNVLPEVPAGLEERHREFLAQIGVADDRPVVLCPVRVFRVKGVEISVRLLAEVRAICVERNEPVPYLLVFGSLGEDPEYTAEVLAAVEREGVADDVRFLDGVPLGSHRQADGTWRLDEIDLLRICGHTAGGVFFTPNRPDVESVGLGPALAALAGVPSASTGYAARDEFYGSDFGQVRVDPQAPKAAADQFVEWMAANRRRDRTARMMLAANQVAVQSRFPAGPWQTLLEELAGAVDGHGMTDLLMESGTSR